MLHDTTLWVRLALWILLFLLAGVAGLVHIAGLISAQSYPELSHLRVPIYIAVLVGLIPILLGVRAAFNFLSLVDEGEAFSTETVRLFRRLKILLAVTAGYLLAGLVGTWVAIGEMHFSLLFAWFGAEVIIAFLITLMSLLEGLFSNALALRTDSELTV